MTLIPLKKPFLAAAAIALALGGSFNAQASPSCTAVINKKDKLILKPKNITKALQLLKCGAKPLLEVECDGKINTKNYFTLLGAAWETLKAKPKTKKIVFEKSNWDFVCKMKENSAPQTLIVYNTINNIEDNSINTIINDNSSNQFNTQDNSLNQAAYELSNAA